MMLKYSVHVTDPSDFVSNNKEDVLLVDITPIGKDSFFSMDDILGMISQLGLNEMSFDEGYTGYDILRFVSNNDYALSFFFVDAANTIYMSVVFKNAKSKKIFHKVLDIVKNLKVGERIQIKH